MWPENGLELVSLVLFWIASGPDSVAHGDYLLKFEIAGREMVGPDRVELSTSALSERRSNQLSYEPISLREAVF